MGDGFGYDEGGVFGFFGDSGSGRGVSICLFIGGGLWGYGDGG